MSVTIVGLGPAGSEFLDSRVKAMLTDSEATVIVRTLDHPAAMWLSEAREVVACDDLYDTLDDFDAVYEAISQRVIDAALAGPVVYAVPGSPLVGERTARDILSAAADRGMAATVVPATSFLDLAYLELGIDPITDGLQVLDARDLPDPLPLHVPTLITQVDSALRCADVSSSLDRLLGAEGTVTVVDRLGDDDQAVVAMTVADLARYEGGPRTSVFVPSAPVGVLGLIATNRVLRQECPWDRKQTHHSLLAHLVEEAYETADAIAQLAPDAPGGDVDFGAYAEVEDELGDLLLQVVFHATLASEAGAFDIDDVAEMNRRKLVNRHPHVFGDVVVADAEEVKANWEAIKGDEKARESLMDDVPGSMPAVVRSLKVQKRAANVGFDWASAGEVFDVVRRELDELEAEAGARDATAAELGDVLFSVVNLARKLDVDPEVALRGSVDRFMARFRHMEQQFVESGQQLGDATLSQLDAAWERAKAELG